MGCEDDASYAEVEDVGNAHFVLVFVAGAAEPNGWMDGRRSLR